MLTIHKLISFNSNIFNRGLTLTTKYKCYKNSVYTQLNCTCIFRNFNRNYLFSPQELFCFRRVESITLTYCMWRENAPYHCLLNSFPRLSFFSLSPLLFLSLRFLLLSSLILIHTFHFLFPVFCVCYLVSFIPLFCFSWKESRNKHVFVVLRFVDKKRIFSNIWTL